MIYKPSLLALAACITTTLAGNTWCNKKKLPVDEKKAVIRSLRTYCADKPEIPAKRAIYAKRNDVMAFYCNTQQVPQHCSDVGWDDAWVWIQNSCNADVGGRAAYLTINKYEFFQYGINTTDDVNFCGLGFARAEQIPLVSDFAFVEEKSEL